MSLLKIMTASVLCAALCSCTADAASKPQDDTPHTLDVFAMDTYMSMKAYGENAETALGESEKLIMKLESDLSAVSEESCIYQLNNANGKESKVTDDAAAIIQKALEIGESTDGALDITIYPLLKEWGFTTGEYHVPDEEKIDELLSLTDYRQIVINGNAVSLPIGCQIDLGSVAKGYTGDKIADTMKENGVTSAILSLGGNVQAVGSKPDGSAWKVAVRDPFNPDKDMCVVEIRDKAVITSGNYERFFTDDNGNDYWHILDPADGFPADNGIVSATVIGPSGIDCDALSTALFVLGKEKSEDYWRKNKDFDMILVSDDGIIYYTDGLSESFDNLSSMDAEVLEFD